MIENAFKLEVEALISREISYVTEEYTPSGWKRGIGWIEGGVAGSSPCTPVGNASGAADGNHQEQRSGHPPESSVIRVARAVNGNIASNPLTPEALDSPPLNDGEKPPLCCGILLCTQARKGPGFGLGSRQAVQEAGGEQGGGASFVRPLRWLLLGAHTEQDCRPPRPGSADGGVRVGSGHARISMYRARFSEHLRPGATPAISERPWPEFLSLGTRGNHPVAYTLIECKPCRSDRE